ncbi:hypothetical protein GGQ22_12270 [Nocardioides sp. zg-579]|uniref:ATP-grasp domain-containing protein n=1 Tax=Nocardioides marmotae TaxID=2663857 RepID=A0A6I3JCF2_9ACTN|nr:hypothetical protein [Nocardioides marmotae]MCR6032209.1 hypothetical protein [Gordonia jinghuaiqii]MTB95856.1 hypothetical protein [Nocardioides marmotae]QKE02794.1 hypothetical protein HPC71_18265 [Nocardioides marmotae]
MQRDRLRKFPGLVAASRALYSLPYRRRALTQRDGSPRIEVAFVPERPHPLNAAWKICTLNGYKITSTTGSPGREPALAVHFSGSTERPAPASLSRLSCRVLNQDCDDISKRAVETASLKAFGYGLAIDPLTHAGMCVEKSDANATHDGRELLAPLGDDAVRPGRVYQRVVDNMTDDGTEVVDLRPVVMGDQIVLVYRKYRPVSDRFSNVNTRTELLSSAEAFDEEERAQILTFCAAMGIDYGELDVLRDRSDGRIYVVDANPTPNGPANHLSPADHWSALDMMCAAWREEFMPA